MDLSYSQTIICHLKCLYRLALLCMGIDLLIRPRDTDPTTDGFQFWISLSSSLSLYLALSLLFYLNLIYFYSDSIQNLNNCSSPHYITSGVRCGSYRDV